MKEAQAYILCQEQPLLFNRFMMTSTNRIQTKIKEVDENTRDIYGQLHTAKGVLKFRDSVFRNQCTQWNMEVPVAELEQMEALLETPFEIDMDEVELTAGHVRDMVERLDERVIYQFFIPSPIVAISRCMDFEMFLEVYLTERELILEGLKEITRRQL